MVDVVVVGAGPAGRAVAAACSDIGLRVTLVAPTPRRVWPHTYGSWLDELPTPIARDAVAATADRVIAYGTTRHEWSRPYAVLDNTALWQHLWRADVDEVIGKVVGAEHGETGSTVHLRDGRRIATAAVVDASGSTRTLSGGRPTRTPVQQTAVGAVLHPEDVTGLVEPGSGVFMDWRQIPGTRGGWPTFLYAVPRGTDEVLLEETSLARRPALPLAVLRRRLRSRLAQFDIAVPDDAIEERVRFPVDDPVPRPGRVVPFGAAGGLIHPTTGFSVAASLGLAPWVAAAISAGLRSGPATAARAAWSVLWPPGALTAHALRRRALQALLTLPPERVPTFFENFFVLDDQHRRAFLAASPDPHQTATAMASIFRTAPWDLRRMLVTGALALRRPHAQHGLGGL